MTNQLMADAAAAAESPWHKHFVIDGVPGGPIRMRQIDRKQFVVESTIVYKGSTGLDGKLGKTVLAGIAHIDPDFKPTDLTSVPGPARWFLGSYGAHTPAALIHDRLIPAKDSGFAALSDQYADRYFRFMLEDLGVRWLKRWVMWMAVAMRTRWKAGGWRTVSLVVWLVAALAGMTGFALAAVAGSVPWMLATAAAPLPFAALWGKQYGAGLVGSIAAPMLVPPTILAMLGYAAYVVVEFVLGYPAGADRRGTGTFLPEGT